MSRSTAGRASRITLLGLLVAGALSGAPQSADPAGAATGDAVDVLAPQTLRANGAELNWTKYSGPSGAAFDRYEVHRSEAAGFTPSAATLLTVIRDPAVTTYTDTTAAPGKGFSYKVVANASASTEQRVTLPAEGSAVTELQPAPQDGKATYVEKASSGTVSCATNGARPNLTVGASTWVDRPLLQFDLTDIPANANVTSATLQLYRPTASPKAVSVDAHRVRGEWTEGNGSSACTGAGATWDETEGGVSWAAKGGDIDTTAAATVTHAAGWDSFDVRSAAQTWANGGAPNLGLLLKARDEAPTAANAFDYVSDDEVSNPSQRPKLKVVFADTAKSKGPGVDVSSPEDGSQVSGTTTIQASAGDDRKVAQVQFFVDGASLGTDTTEPFSAAWATTSATNASHSLTAKATDDVGNTTTSPAISVTVANSAPPTTKVTSTSTSYPDVVRSSGAYGYWRLGEATGTAFADSSGKGNGGVFSGTLQRGTAGLLTGDTDQSTRFLNTAPSGTGTVSSLAGQSSQYVSAEAWVDYAGTGPLDQEGRIVSRGWGASGGWQLALKTSADGKPRAVWAVNVGGTVQQVTAPIVPGKLHLIGRFTGSTVGLFVNGVYAYGVATAAQVLNTTNSVVIGGALAEDITLDDVALYPKSISTGEASAHYDVGMGRTPVLKASPTVTADASDDQSVDRVDFFVDGSRFATDTTSPYSATLSTQSADDPVYDGAHTISSKAVDSDGQEKDSTASAVTVANTAGSGYQADITTPDPPAEITYDAAATTPDVSGMDVTVKNTSPNTWAADDIVLRPRWVSSDNTPDITEQPEVSLAAAVAPGQALTKTVKVTAPALPAGVDQAQYTLRVDLLSKSTTTFFAQKGNKPFEKPVKVKDAASSDQLGLERFYDYEGEQLGGGMQHLANVATGNSLLRFTPMSSTGRGLSTVVDLTYNALENHSESPVGPNFSLAISGLTRLGNPLDIHPNKADQIGGNAKRWIDFTDGDGTTQHFVGQSAADGTVYWQEPAGVHLYLRVFSTTDPNRKWAITRPDRVTYFFDADGYPTGTQDKNGNRIDCTLEATPPGEDPGGPKKRITAVTDAAGTGATPAANRKYTITYWTKADAPKAKVRGKIRKVIDHSGSEVTFAYYEDGNLLRVAQTGGKKADGSRLVSRAWYFTYTTPNGDASAIPLAADRQQPSAKTPSQSSRLFSVRDPRKRETTFAYLGSANGQDRWKLASRTDRAGAVTSYGYDNLNRVTTVTAPLDRVSKYTYDTDGKVTKTTNPKSEDTTVLWTADRHVQKVTQPTGKYTEYAYNANGQLTDVYDELRDHTTIGYENVAADADADADANDASGKWASGRTIPHISQMTTKTAPKGVATASPADDYQWSFAYDASGNVKTVTDPAKAATSYAYNADGTLASSTDPLAHATQYKAYDPSGQPTEIADAKGQTTQLGYDDDGYLRWVQDPKHYGDTGANPREYRSYFDYDTWHRMGRQSAPLSTRDRRGMLIWTGVNFDYDDNVILSAGPHYGAQDDGSGAKTRLEYDVMDREERGYGPDTSADPNGERWRNQYDLAGRVIEATDPRGLSTLADDKDGTTLVDYDKLDRVTKQTRYESDGTTVVNTLNSFQCYDTAGDLRAVVPPKAKVATVDCSNLATLPLATRFDYDDAHRQLSTTDPLGHKTQTEYDANDQGVASTDAQGAKTTTEYDQRGMPVKTTQPFVVGTAPRNIVSVNEYDAAGNLKRQISPRAYDASTDKVTFGSYVTSFDYDAADQLTRTSLPTAGGDAQPQLYVHQAYDANGAVVTTTMPDAAADIASVAPDRKTQVGYFDPGWVATTADKGKPTVRFDYTAEGWQSSRTPDKSSGGPDVGKQHTWNYFVDGMLKEERIASDESNSAVNTYEYDAGNNLTRTHTTSGIGDATKQAPYEVLSSYDSLNRPTKTRQKQDTDANYDVSSFGYDLNDNLVARTQGREETAAGAVTKPGRAESFEYDDADWMRRQLDQGQTSAPDDDRRITTDYFPAGWEKSQTVEQSDAAGAYTTKRVTNSDYFANGQLKTLNTVNGAGAAMESHAVSYLDASGAYVNGNPVTDTFKVQGPNTAAPCRATNCTTAYTYDPRDRLTKEHTDGPSTPKDISYALDAAGNIKTESHSDAGGQWAANYTYDGDRLKTEALTGNASGSVNFFYDNTGALKCKTTAAGVAANCTPPSGTTPDASVRETYAYDSNSRLLSYRQFDAGSAKTKDSQYSYDAFDRPVEQNESAAGGSARTTLTKYIGTSDDVGSEERRAGTTATGTLQDSKSYSYDAFGRRSAMSDKAPGATSSKDFEYADNPHGDVSMLLDSAGKAQVSYGYSAYGQTDDAMTQERDPSDATKVLDPKAAATNPLNLYRYSDKRMDPSSGTLDMGARRFGPDTSHFLQEDLYKDALSDLDLATDPLTQNRYSLAGGNPVSFIEVDGHRPDASQRNRHQHSAMARRAHPRPQETSQSPDSYDRNNRPAYQQQVDRSYAAATAENARANVAKQQQSQQSAAQRQQRSANLDRSGAAASIGAGTAEGARRRNRKLTGGDENRGVRRARRAQLRSDPVGRAGSKLANRAGRLLGPVGLVGGGVLDYQANRAGGDSPGKAVRESVVNGAAGAAGGYAGGAACGAAIVTVVAAPACPFLLAGGAGAGYLTGKLVNNVIDDAFGG